MDKKEKKPSTDLADIFNKGFRQCPSTDALLTYLESRKTDQTIEHHIKYCPLCKKEFEFMKSEFKPSELKETQQHLKTKKKITKKSLTYKYIEIYAPNQLEQFSSFWGEYRDTTIKKYRVRGQQISRDSIKPSGPQKTPEILWFIAFLNYLTHTTNLDTQELFDEQILKKIDVSEVIREFGLPKDTIKRFIHFIRETLTRPSAR